MQFQQRHNHLGGGSNPVDVYPEIDGYIPDAVAIANLEFPGVDEKGAASSLRAGWSLCFMGAMDRILKKKGLRV